MTSVRPFRLPGAAALFFALVGCSSPQPASTATPAPAAASAKAAPVIRSTAPIHVRPIRIVAAATTPPLTRSNGIPSPYVIPSVAQSPKAIARSRGTATPRATARPVAQATQKPMIVPTPTPTPTPKLPYVYAAPHAPPRIIAINISTLNAHAGQTVSGDVETTSNVASVEVRIAGWGMSLPRPRIGYFEGSGVIPQLPPFAKGTYTLQVIARNVDGMRTERDFPITLR